MFRHWRDAGKGQEYTMILAWLMSISSRERKVTFPGWVGGLVFVLAMMSLASGVCAFCISQYLLSESSVLAHTSVLRSMGMMFLGFGYLFCLFFGLIDWLVLRRVGSRELAVLLNGSLLALFVGVSSWLLGADEGVGNTPVLLQAGIAVVSILSATYMRFMSPGIGPASLPCAKKTREDVLGYLLQGVN